jgi:signal transduction histidine kinase
VDLSSYVERLEDRMENITNMIDNLLIYSIADKEVITIDNVDLNECVKYVEDNLSTLISETNTRINYDDLPTVKADKGQIIQLLQNLVENSIKYKSELPPEIEIKYKILKNECQITVKDNGIGIPKDKQDQVFNLFNQAHSEIKKKGFGIGLSICKKIIERYNGESWVESEEGKGTAFTFTLPYVDGKIN